MFSTEEWEQWVHSEGQELVRLGIPEVILKNEWVWNDFLEHARLEKHPDLSDFTVDDIPEMNFPRLLEILLASYPMREMGMLDLGAILWGKVHPNRPLWDE